jgi:hypothetical protein
VAEWALLKHVESPKPVSKTVVDRIPGPDEVVVKAIEISWPTGIDDRWQFLFDSFANREDEKKFSRFVTSDWHSDFAIFARVLLQKATEKGLDSSSLRKCLDLTQVDAGDHRYYLPVGAYQTTIDGNKAWIIVVKWEFGDAPRTALGHICIFGFDQKTLAMWARCSCT